MLIWLCRCVASIPLDPYIYICVCVCGGGRVIGISGSVIRSRTLMELIFNACGEFRWSPECPGIQIHSPHLHVGVPWIFSKLLRSMEILKRERGVESNGKLLHLFTRGKLQSWCLSLQWKTCLQQSCTCCEGPALGQYTLMMMILYIILWLLCIIFCNVILHLNFAYELSNL